MIIQPKYNSPSSDVSTSNGSPFIVTEVILLGDFCWKG
jgi:hypothetical protein